VQSGQWYKRILGYGAQHKRVALTGEFRIKNL